MSDWVALKNALNLTFRPVHEWPGKMRFRREIAPYSAPLKDTIKVLQRELRMLSAKKVVLQIAIRERDLRLDGLPRSGAVAEHPGIILSFETADGPKMRAFDRFTKWEYNLRALALNLEHLRLANLYGVEERNQQYRGWNALPPGSSAGEETPIPLVEGEMTDIGAAMLLAAYSGMVKDYILDSKGTYLKAAQAATLAAHPDNGGSHEEMTQVNKARTILDRRHGL